MTSSDSKIEKIQTHFKALSSVAPTLNAASDELTKAVAVLDENLKKLNVGLTAWVTFRSRAVHPSMRDEEYDDDESEEWTKSQNSLRRSARKHPKPLRKFGRRQSRSTI